MTNSRHRGKGALRTLYYGMLNRGKKGKKRGVLNGRLIVAMTNEEERGRTVNLCGGGGELSLYTWEEIEPQPSNTRKKATTSNNQDTEGRPLLHRRKPSIIGQKMRKRFSDTDISQKKKTHKGKKEGVQLFYSLREKKEAIYTLLRQRQWGNGEKVVPSC